MGTNTVSVSFDIPAPPLGEYEQVVEYRPPEKGDLYWSVSMLQWFKCNSTHVCGISYPTVRKIKIKPVRREVWANIYENGSVFTLYESRKKADAGALPGRTACIRLQYEKGQFDD